MGDIQRAPPAAVFQGLIPVFIQHLGLGDQGQGVEPGADNVVQAGVFQGFEVALAQPALAGDDNGIIGVMPGA